MHQTARLPAFLSTVLPRWPGCSRTSKLPSRAVAVCCTVSLLTHTIVSPTLAPVGMLPKTMLSMVTVNSRGPLSCAPAGRAVAVARKASAISLPAILGPIRATSSCGPDSVPAGVGQVQPTHRAGRASERARDAEHDRGSVGAQRIVVARRDQRRRPLG